MITRKDFLKHSIALTASLATTSVLAGEKPSARANQEKTQTSGKTARAITMWDFSWLERRWDGAGYEDWNQALDGLLVRGYNAVRIDAFPHLLAHGAEQEWTLLPVWDQQVWGSADINRVRILPALLEFIGKCKSRGIKVGLSSWFREDSDNTRMKITSADKMAEIWIKTLDAIKTAGLLDAILYTDLCNEWPGNIWAPFLKPELEWGQWHAESSQTYMRRAISLVREKFPDMPLLFSFDNGRVENYLEHDLHYFDLLEHHIWAVSENESEFYKLVGYNFERFDTKGYRNLSLYAETVYRARPDYWQGLLTAKIDRLAAVSRQLNKPLVTTECWGIIDYKDWPLLKWDWVKELCEVGVKQATASGQWAAIATSNFCGPQFVGMWRDIEWHQKLTQLIKTSNISHELQSGNLCKRL